MIYDYMGIFISSIFFFVTLWVGSVMHVIGRQMLGLIVTVYGKTILMT